MSNVVSITAAPVPVVDEDSERKPRPYVFAVDNEETEWAPTAIKQYITVNGVRVRSGNSYAIVREGYERWPLGHSSDRYHPEGHQAGFEAVVEFAGDQVAPGQSYSSAHGYQVAREYGFKLIGGDTVTTARGPIAVNMKLVLTHDHTAKGSTRASLVLYVDGQAVGAILRRNMRHVGAQSTRFRQDIAGLAENAIIGKTVVLDLFKLAAEKPYTEVEKRFFARRDMKPRRNPITKKEPTTLLEACQLWLRGNTKKITWNTWHRRLDDHALRVMVELLGPATVGAALDEGLGGLKGSTRYSFLKDGTEECKLIALDIKREEEEAAAKEAAKRAKSA